MPVEMPAYAFSGISVHPELGVASARSEGGLIITSRKSDPYWRGRMTTVRLQPWGGDNKYADMLAFLSRCVDLNLLVDIVHPRHRLPRAYSAATWPMVGNAELTNVTDLRHIVVSGLSMALLLKRGDRVSIVQDDLIAHRWIATDTTVSSILAQTLELTPRLPIGVFAAGAAVVLENPKLRVRIVPGSWDADEVSQPSAISFEVEEALA